MINEIKVIKFVVLLYLHLCVKCHLVISLFGCLVGCWAAWHQFLRTLRCAKHAKRFCETDRRSIVDRDDSVCVKIELNFKFHFRLQGKVSLNFSCFHQNYML